MGILKNFESWAHSDNDNNSNQSRKTRVDGWARQNNNRNWDKPSNNPAVDIDDSSLYNPHSDYHNYKERIDDIDEFNDL